MPNEPTPPTPSSQEPDPSPEPWQPTPPAASSELRSERPAEPPSLVPSDEDRLAVIAAIQQALADDAIEFEDVDDRFAAVYEAGTQAELRAVVADLPDLRRTPPIPEARHLAPRSNMLLLGDQKIGGWLAVEGDMSITTLIGDVVIDLSSATLPAGGVSVTAMCLIGDVKVILPDGVRVQTEMTGLIGDRRERLTQPREGAPTVRVTTRVGIGDCRVYSLSMVPVGPLRRLWAALRKSPDS